VKYRLTSYLYDDFFKYHLGPKLSDFLVEERRRNERKTVRQQEKVINLEHQTQQSIND
jgi:hypothetical protein